jgi:zinc metalloprotease ZmpA
MAKSRLALALAVSLLAGLAGAPVAQAAGSTAAARALANVTAFPGRSMHGPGQTYSVRDVIVDGDGTEHVRLDRQYQGLRVIGGDMVVHSTGRGVLLDVSRTLNRLLMLNTRPYVSEAMATSVALAANPGYGQSGRAELVVNARADFPELGYDVSIAGQKADATPSQLHVIVDALRGKVMDAWDEIETAAASGTGRGFFNGTVALTTNSLTSGFELRDPSRGNQYTINMNNRTSGGSIFTDADNAWGDGTLSNVQTVGVDAQYGTSVTWDYYKNVHGRNGIANNGTGAYNRVHYSRRYNNAFWSDSCFCMTYGDGDGTTFNPFDSLDVAGHEMSHGVTSRTANLTYSGESGGLNEGTSDIFGTAVEFYANNPNDPGDYLIGEKLYKSGNSALRTMINPSLDGASSDCWYSGVGSLNVHYSSGVANHFFYLLSEGTTNGSPSKTCVAGNTRVASGTDTVAGIGRAKAERIWYRALTVYMTSSTNYAGARTATTNAATDLYGAGSPESNAVAAAWMAVGRP